MDIVIVTYNSSKWIKKCLDSIYLSEKIDERINIYIVDNFSTDDTCDIINDCLINNELYSGCLISEKKNWGFGVANNIGARAGKDDIICFINIDTEVFNNTFKMLKEEIKKSDSMIGAWEMRQLPYEHPKFYDVLTGETSWMSGAAFAMRRSVFEKIDGFDPNIFMYAEDVDISWRMRTHGYKIKYCPKVMINHYSFQSVEQVKPTQYLGSIQNNLFLRYRFGNIYDVINGHQMFWKVLLFDSSPFKNAKKLLLSSYLKHWKNISKFLNKKNNNIKVAKFLGWDYELIRDGAGVKIELPIKTPLVSIIIRTCQRPDVLREALVSVRNQTYNNIEIIVVEDGESTAKDMIDKEFNDLNIKYTYTGDKLGRSAAGNVGLEYSNGEYLNFLDDDDVFYADHVEVLVNAIQKSNVKAVYSYGLETPIQIESVSPYRYKIIDYIGRYKEKFDVVKLAHHNFMPIQCVLFSRELYEKYGGFDTSLDYLEDWDLWVRFMQGTDYLCIPKTTSQYRVPANNNKQQKRQKELDEALLTVRKKHEEYYVRVAVSELVKYGEEDICQTISKKFRFNR